MRAILGWFRRVVGGKRNVQLVKASNWREWSLLRLITSLFHFRLGWCDAVNDSSPKKVIEGIVLFYWFITLVLL